MACFATNPTLTSKLVFAVVVSFAGVRAVLTASAIFALAAFLAQGVFVHGNCPTCGLRRTVLGVRQ
eukprot:5216551-Amphidinium_carterae.2